MNQFWEFMFLTFSEKVGQKGLGEALLLLFTQ